MKLKGKKHKWFIRLGTGITTVLGGAVGNYIGGAITSLYAKGGKTAAVNKGIAKTFAKYTKASLTKTKGKGWKLNFKKYTLRIMNKEEEKNYLRS